MKPSRTLVKETDNFISACEAIHALLEREPLPTEDRDAIIIIARDLLTELKA
jgi:hypothetical protein